MNKIFDSSLKSKSSRSCHKVEDQGKRTAFETGLAQLGKESDPDKAISSGEALLREISDTIEKQKQKKTEEPQIGDVALLSTAL